MRVILTGAKGFIGRNLLAALERRGYNVLQVERDYYDHPHWQERAIELVGSADVVFHVGADSSTTNTNVNEVLFLNYETTLFWSETCARLGVKLIYSSSAATYGVNGLPSNLYGWSKKMGEDIVLKNKQVSLRYFNVYGPGEECKGDMSSVAYKSFMKNRRGERVELFPGSPRRDFVYVLDVVRANLYALDLYKDCSVHEVGSGSAQTFESVLDILCIPYTISFENPLLYNGYQTYTLSNPAMYIPGWEPLYNLERGLKDYRDYLCKLV